EQFDLLKRTLGNIEMSDDEFTLFMVEAARLGLDPVTRQIVPVMFWSSKRQRSEMSIIIAITGMRSLCQRTNQEDGTEGPEFTEDGLNWTKLWLADDHPPVAARFTVYRKGMSRGYEGVAKWSEFVRKRRDGGPERFWADMPQHMLGKCAEAVARRMAFADQLQGVYVAEEFGGTTPEQAVDAVRRTPDSKRLPPAAPTSPEAVQGAMVATLWNSLGKQDRPAPQEMEEVRGQQGRAGQVAHLIGLHEKLHRPCSHVTAAMRAVVSVPVEGAGGADDGGGIADEDQDAGGESLPGLDVAQQERLGHAPPG
ncbi:MAG: phage recombination protein Bet, partial [Candidatus Dormibacteria bacterium]